MEVGEGVYALVFQGEEERLDGMAMIMPLKTVLEPQEMN